MARWLFRVGLVAALCFVVISFTACSLSQRLPLDGFFTLADTHWTLTSMTKDRALQTPVAGTSVTLDFARDGKLSGNSGCNSYGGTYETQGERIKIPMLAVTAMACENVDVMEFEAAYLGALQGAQRFERWGGELTITFADGNGRLRFQQR